MAKSHRLRDIFVSLTIVHVYRLYSSTRLAISQFRVASYDASDEAYRSLSLNVKDIVSNTELIQEDIDHHNALRVRELSYSTVSMNNTATDLSATTNIFTFGSSAGHIPIILYPSASTNFRISPHEAMYSDNDNSNSYFHDTNDYNTSDPLHQLIPIRVLNKYKQQHSETALRNNPHGRKYAVVYYSCPMQAGNRLHHFFNSILWSIVTNRTVLWKYYDNETCTEMGDQVKDCDQQGGPFVCKESNRVEDCDQILQRSSWIPSYDQWAPTLQLGPIEPLHYWSTRPRTAVVHEVQECPWKDEFVNRTGAASWSDKQVVRFPRMVSSTSYMIKEEHIAELSLSEHQRSLAEQLFDMGPSFFYGMLFRDLFTFVHPSFQTSELRVNFDNDSVFSIALHSRRVILVKNPKWHDINGEMGCLRKLVTPESVQNRTCVVHAMADRPRTLEMLDEELHTLNCSLKIVTNHSSGVGTRDEHGPWAGLGFFQDLVLTSQARNGVVLSRRGSSTSSWLMKELVDYDRTVEHVLNGNSLTSLPPLLTCK
jgi:hypothetical protein